MEKIDRNDSVVNRKGLHIEIVVGAAGYEVVVGFVRDFDACFRIGMLCRKTWRSENRMNNSRCVCAKGGASIPAVVWDRNWTKSVER